MQRKLSEIAEIPKILSSTLATVSQTFEKLQLNGVVPKPNYLTNELYQQKRKLSYDEDAYDYELSDEEGDGEDANDNDDLRENFNAREAYLRLKQHVARQRRSKEVTPESDYASENNYSLDGNEQQGVGQVKEYDDKGEEEGGYGDDDEDDESNADDVYEKFNLSYFLKSQGHEMKADETESDGDGENDDDDDFLTTTFTWSMPNKSKLRLNDNNSTDTSAHVPQNNENNYMRAASVECADDAEAVDKYSKAMEQSSLDNASNSSQSAEECSMKQPKLDKFWPWADREKIIYKQSTCHLVPKKPLGLIEQRIQLLAKHNLLEHLGPNNKNNQ
uniref:Uncharacterized protein n=1 Tax=Stomoxys calcitrans TaxID=35570 RepID=A0A1I8Q0V8_STOCA